MSTCLVTGGAGFIGSHVVDHLIAAGHRVVVLDDLSGGFQTNVNPKASLCIGSVTDPMIEELFAREKFDYVYHLAAYAAEGLSHFIRKFNYTNNLLGSVNLINAAVRHKVKCFVFTSSIAVYGSALGQYFHETQTPHPEDPYGISKYAVELDLWAARKLFGLNYVIFRPHNVYGERQNIGDPYRNVIGIFMNQMLHDRICTVFGDGTQTRAFTHIDDVAPVIASSATDEVAQNMIFNIGADTSCSVNELLEHVKHAMGKEQVEVTYLPPRVEAVHASANHTRLESLLGVKARVSLRDGLYRMAVWAKREGARWSKPFTELEIEERLPGVWKQMISDARAKRVP